MSVVEDNFNEKIIEVNNSLKEINNNIKKRLKNNKQESTIMVRIQELLNFLS